MNRLFTDEELIEAVKTGGPKMEQAMGFLYQSSGYKNEITRRLQKQGVQEDRLNDIFQDGVRHLIINIRKGQFRGDSALKTYLSRICTNLWSTQYRRGKRLEEIKLELPIEKVTMDTPDQILEYKEKGLLLTEVLSQLGKSCKKVLGLWSLSYSMNEIAKKVGYKSEGMARKKKYDCFKRLMKHLHDRPDLMEELLNNR